MPTGGRADDLDGLGRRDPGPALSPALLTGPRPVPGAPARTVDPGQALTTGRCNRSHNRAGPPSSHAQVTRPCGLRRSRHRAHRWFGRSRGVAGVVVSDGVPSPAAGASRVATAAIRPTERGLVNHSAAPPVLSRVRGAAPETPVRGSGRHGNGDDRRGVNRRAGTALRHRRSIRIGVDPHREGNTATLQRIDPRNDSVTGTVDLGLGEPGGGFFYHSGLTVADGSLWVSEFFYNQVTPRSTRPGLQVTRRIDVGRSPISVLGVGELGVGGRLPRFGALSYRHRPEPGGADSDRSRRSDGLQRRTPGAGLRRRRGVGQRARAAATVRS